jgi:hypothetical protein
MSKPADAARTRGPGDRGKGHDRTSSVKYSVRLRYVRSDAAEPGSWSNVRIRGVNGWLGGTVVVFPPWE